MLDKKFGTWDDSGVGNDVVSSNTRSDGLVCPSGVLRIVRTRGMLWSTTGRPTGSLVFWGRKEVGIETERVEIRRETWNGQHSDF